MTKTDKDFATYFRTECEKLASENNRLKTRMVSRKHIEQILRAIDSDDAKLKRVRNMLIYALGLKEVP